MALELDAERAVCFRCGTAYGRRKGNFPVSYSVLYKGIGYLPYCRNCVETMFNDYLKQCGGDTRQAVRQMCRKLDLYWHSTIFDSVEKKTTSRTIMTNYIQRVNNIVYAGKSYDDTLKAEHRLWEDEPEPVEEPEPEAPSEQKTASGSGVPGLTMDDIPEEVIEFWGPGYTPKMYSELEQRLQYYRGQMPEDMQSDLGTETLLRQIAMMEIDINRARADGRPVDKMVNSLNSLLSSLNKPQKGAAQDASAANTPFGVWIKRWEDERPLPEIDESMKDVDGIVKYVLTWVYGHMAHMLKIRNARTPLYDDAVRRLRVEHPEYDDEDDDTMLYDLFGDGEPDAGSDE